MDVGNRVPLRLSAQWGHVAEWLRRSCRRVFVRPGFSPAVAVFYVRRLPGPSHPGNLLHEMIGFIAPAPDEAIGRRLTGAVGAERSSGRIQRGKDISEAPAHPERTPRQPPLVRARAGPLFPWVRNPDD
jgi:hypothetical protein